MLKWACAIVLMIDVILFGVAGYRLITLPPASENQPETNKAPAVRIANSDNATEVDASAAAQETAAEAAEEDDYTHGDRNTYEVSADNLDEVDDTANKQEGLEDAKKRMGNIFGGNE